MNPYMNINRIEFVVTYSCTSRCKHCSISEMLGQTGIVEKEAAVKAVTDFSRIYNIQSVMTFGGEPLLYADTVCAIHETAMKCNIPKRQIITNGHFTNDRTRISQVAANLKKSGVNSLLLSIDAFHKEFIPLEKVHPFAKALCDEHIEGLKLHPAWVINREDSGNAAVYLSEFYDKPPLEQNIKCGKVPYANCFDEIETVTIYPSGDTHICGFTIGNIYKESISEIVNRFNPNKHPLMSVLIKGGLSELLNMAEKDGIKVDFSKCYSECSVCHEIVKNTMLCKRKGRIKHYFSRQNLKGIIMRAPFQILAIPYRMNNGKPVYCVFHRSDFDQWQFISGGGEDTETPMEAAKREIF